MTALENLREKFADVHKNFDNFLEQHHDVAVAAINAAEKAAGDAYEKFDGHKKMEFAISFLLEQIHIPGPFAVMASQQIVDRTEAFIQNVYNAKIAKES